MPSSSLPASTATALTRPGAVAASPAPFAAPFAAFAAALNPAQQAAVDHGCADPDALPSPLLVVAGAGSGKTLTLASRVARLLLSGTAPQRLLLMTFSRRAAAEMASRVGRMLHTELGLAGSTPAPTLPWCGTFHSVGARLLREYAGCVGLAPPSS